MNQQVTPAIVLARTNYGEADRIVRLLTPENGKLSLMARGVRKPKSKLAGGIELFSISDLTFIRGRGDLGTLVSARLSRHYGRIVKQIDRVQLGYELIKQLDRAVEDQAEAEYFDLLTAAFEALDDGSIALDLVRFWFQAQLLRLGGHTPNLRTDTVGEALRADQRYGFDFDNATFTPMSDGAYGADGIKYLRLVFAGNEPAVLQQITGGSNVRQVVSPLVQTMLGAFVRV